MIKNISFSGISRIPSARLTDDGACAESLNVHLDTNETAPTISPKDITAEAKLPTDKKYDILFIHKGNGYTNYICQRKNDNNSPSFVGKDKDLLPPTEGGTFEPVDPIGPIGPIRVQYQLWWISSAYHSFIEEYSNEIVTGWSNFIGGISEEEKDALAEKLSNSEYPIAMPGGVCSFVDKDTIAERFMQYLEDEEGLAISDNAVLECYKVGVDPQDIPVSGITLDGASERNIKENEELVIRVEVFPANATNKKVNWEYDSNVFDVDMQREDEIFLLPKKAASTIVTAITDDGDYSVSCRVNIAEVPYESEIGTWEQYEEDGKKEFRFNSFLKLAEGEVFKGITAVGNTLVINTNSNIYFVLYETGDYSVLGTNVPMPKIKITAKDADIKEGLVDTPWGDYMMSYKVGGFLDDRRFNYYEYGNHITTDLMNIATEQWSYNTNDDKIREHYNSIQRTIQALTDKIKEQDKRNDTEGRYGYPVWATYGVRLYDDTVIYANPVLLNGVFDNPYSIIYKSPYTRDLDMLSALVERHHAYTIQYAIESIPEDWEKWKDLIVSVELYVSPMIGLDYQDAKFARWIPFDDKYNGLTMGTYSTSPGVYYTHYGKIVLASRKSDKGTAEDFTNRIKESRLYRLMDFTFDAFVDIPMNMPYDVDSVGKTLTEYIINQPALDMGTAMQVSDYNIGMMSNINQRLIAVTDGEVIKYDKIHHAVELFRDIETAKKARYANLSVVIADRYAEKRQEDIIPQWMDLPDLPKQDDDNSYTITHIYEIKTDRGVIRIKDNPIAFNGRDLVYAACLAHRYSDTKKIYALLHRVEESGMVYVGMHEYDTEELPSMFSVFNVDESRTHVLNIDYELRDIPETTIDYIKTDNSLIVSNAESVFTFNLANKYRFPTPIVGLGFVTKPLSQGQFGQFPLYVFTEGGIYAMEMNVEGTFSNQHMISREVAIPGTITSSEQAVIFATAKGLMAITGSDVQCLSESMNGRHYQLEQSVADTLSQTAWGKYMPMVQDDTPFMKVMANAKCIYDYAGQRFIFATTDPSNDDYKFQYVYKLDTQTWHKIAQIFGEDNAPLCIKRVLNSYPDAYVQVDTNEGARLYSLSTILDVEQTAKEKGVIISRAFDLGSPDVYKTITKLKVRGIFKNDEQGNPTHPVKYLLLGSNDGTNFTLLHSLRGKSWKFFRLVILTDMQPADRFTGVTVEYEERFNNNLR